MQILLMYSENPIYEKDDKFLIIIFIFNHLFILVEYLNHNDSIFKGKAFKGF